MKNQSNGSLFYKYAAGFFDSHTIFKDLAAEVGDQSFFITGATGLFGIWIQAFLKWSEDQKIADPKVQLLSREKVTSRSSKWRWIQGDICQSPINAEPTDYVLHLAAPSASETYNGMNDYQKYKILSVGVDEVLKFTSKHMRKRLLVTSSGAIYGGFDKNRSIPIGEDERLAPKIMGFNDGLAVGKRAVEFLTKYYCNMGYSDASIARCFSFVGPGMPTNLHYAVGNFIKSAVSQEDIVIRGDGHPLRSFMYLGDMVFWLMTILIKGDNGVDYNVGSSNVVSMIDLATIVNEEIAPRVKVNILGGENITPGNPINNFYVPCTLKAKKELGLYELTSLKEAIIKTADFEKNNLR